MAQVVEEVSEVVHHHQKEVDVVEVSGEEVLDHHHHHREEEEVLDHHHHQEAVGDQFLGVAHPVGDLEEELLPQEVVDEGLLLQVVPLMMVMVHRGAMDLEAMILVMMDMEVKVMDLGVILSIMIMAMDPPKVLPMTHILEIIMMRVGILEAVSQLPHLDEVLQGGRQGVIHTRGLHLVATESWIFEVSA